MQTLVICGSPVMCQWLLLGIAREISLEHVSSRASANPERQRVRPHGLWAESQNTDFRTQLYSALQTLIEHLLNVIHWAMPWTLSASSDNREGFLRKWCLKWILKDEVRWWAEGTVVQEERASIRAKALSICLCKSTENMLMAPDKHPHPSGPQVIIFNMKRVQHACAQPLTKSTSSDKSCFWSLFNDMDQQNCVTLLGPFFILWNNQKPLHIHRN